MLEQLLSPLVALAPRPLTRHHAHHYRGLAALHGALDEAQGRTPLPDAPEGRAEPGQIVVDARLQLG